jgi:Tfp pilus assembly protein PilE
MNLFENNRFFPIELMIVLAINAVVAVLAYYSFLVWGFVWG